MNFHKFLATSALLLVVGSWLLVRVPAAFAGDFSGAQAARELCEGTTGGDRSPICEPNDIFRILSKVLRYVYTIFFIVAVIFLLVAAFQFLFTQGEAEKIKNARWALTWAVVAIVIALISVGSAQLIRNFLNPNAS